MPQMPRTAKENRLLHKALGGMDVMYAHDGAAMHVDPAKQDDLLFSDATTAAAAPPPSSSVDRAEAVAAPLLAGLGLGGAHTLGNADLYQ